MRVYVFIFSSGLLLATGQAFTMWTSVKEIPPSQRLHFQHICSLHRLKDQFTLACKGNKFNPADDGVSLSSLEDFNADGLFLKESITRWLDLEYIPQECHTRIGDRVSQIYCDRRIQGITDLGELMMDVGTSLESFDMEKAFVNPWDVANKVADFLMFRMNRELCDCSGDVASLCIQPLDEDVISVSVSNRQSIFQAMPPAVVNIDTIQLFSRNLRTEFSRYTFLRDFLEAIPDTRTDLYFAGDIAWQDIHVVVGLTLGFRVKNGALMQDKTLAPHGWENLDVIPDLTDFAEDFAVSKMQADIPDDEAATDIVLEALAGLEMYKMMKANADPEVQRRILVGKWLYVHNFLGDTFPSEVRYISGHLRDRNDDEEDDCEK